jgi:hypothetical protein
MSASNFDFHQVSALVSLHLQVLALASVSIYFQHQRL